MTPHPHEERWLPYALKSFSNAFQAPTSEYQLEALCAVRHGLSSIPPEDYTEALALSRVRTATLWAIAELKRVRFRKRQLAFESSISYVDHVTIQETQFAPEQRRLHLDYNLLHNLCDYLGPLATRAALGHIPQRTASILNGHSRHHVSRKLAYCHKKFRHAQNPLLP